MIKLKTDCTYEKDATIKTFDQEVKVIDGVKQVVYTERTKDPYEGLTYSDFSLQSLIDADAVDLLQSVGTLSRGQSIVVVARTSNGWYKTIDGFYASETYLQKKPVTA